jgi:tetratricopeptide (TPR) repeat protein
MKHFLATFLLIAVALSGSVVQAEVVAVTVNSTVPSVKTVPVSKCIYESMKPAIKEYFKQVNDLGSFSPSKLENAGAEQRVDTIYRYGFFNGSQAPSLEITKYSVLHKKVLETATAPLSDTWGTPCDQAVMMTWDLDAIKVHPNADPILAEARSLASVGRFDEAGQKYNEAAHASASAGAIYREMGIALENGGKPDWAIEWYKSAAKMDPHEIRSFLRSAGIEKARGGYEAAALYLEYALDAGPQPPRLWIEVAQMYEKLGRWELAWRALIRANELDPSNEKTVRSLVQNLDWDDQWAKATEYQKGLLDRHPHDQIVKRDLLTLYMKAENYGEAESILRLFTAGAPNEPYWIEALGRVLEGQQDFDGARKQFERLLSIDPESLTGHYALAQIGYRQRRFAEARTHLDWVLDKIPGHDDAWRMLGRIQEMERDYLGAIESQEKVMIYTEGVRDADLLRLFSLGRQAGNMALAEQAVNEAANFKSRADRRQLIMAAAEVMVRDGRNEQARAYLESRMGQLDRHGPAYMLLGKLLLEAGEVEQAEGVFKTAVFFTTDDSMPVNVGILFYKMGRFSDAQFFYRFAYNRNDKNPKTLLQYLEICLLNEDVDAAIWPLLDAAEMELAPLYQQYLTFLELLYAKMKPDQAFFDRVYPFALTLLESQGPTGRLDLANFRPLIDRTFKNNEKDLLNDLVKLFEGTLTVEAFKAAH